jgi:hypothetical protein
MRILYKFLRKVTVLFLGTPLGCVVIIGTMFGLIWEAFKWGFQIQTEEVMDKLYHWDKE